jgi:hypothetical protein
VSGLLPPSMDVSVFEEVWTRQEKHPPSSNESSYVAVANHRSCFNVGGSLQLLFTHWIPAKAGMTSYINWGDRSLSRWSPEDEEDEVVAEHYFLWRLISGELRVGLVIR